MRVNLANEKQRREFIRNYEAWGVWFYEPRLRISYYKCELPDGSEIVVEEQTGVGRHSPRVVQALRYHLITPTGKYQLNGSSMEDMLRCLRSLPNEIDVLIGGYDEAI